MSVEIAIGMHRFEALLRGSGECEWDQLLLEGPDWVVAPTLGAVVAGWLLAIPRRRALCFRDWAALEMKRPEAIVADIRRHLGLTQEEVIWFEHGPRDEDTVVGCGLDYAHLHILLRPPFDFPAFQRAAIRCRSLEWRPTSSGKAYSELESGKTYMIVGCGERAIVAHNVEIAGSQFLRKVVAGLVGKAAIWDYHRFPQEENISRTISIFRTLESAAQDGW